VSLDGAWRKTQPVSHSITEAQAPMHSEAHCASSARRRVARDSPLASPERKSSRSRSAEIWPAPTKQSASNRCAQCFGVCFACLGQTALPISRVITCYHWIPMCGTSTPGLDDVSCHVDFIAIFPDQSPFVATGEGDK
jgi:hypothetical protein